MLDMRPRHSVLCANDELNHLLELVWAHAERLEDPRKLHFVLSNDMAVMQRSNVSSNAAPLKGHGVVDGTCPPAYPQLI